MSDDQIIAKARLWAGLARPGIEVDRVRIIPWGEGRAVSVDWCDGHVTAWELDAQDEDIDLGRSADVDDPAFAVWELPHGTPSLEDGEDDELENIVRCERCGQAVDLGQFDQVAHHRRSEHKPLPRN